MSEPAPVGPPTRRRTPTTGDLLRSLVPLTALVLLAVWLYSPGGQTPVQVIDAGPSFSYAASLDDFAVLAPSELPSGWRPTSARVDPAVPGGPVGLRVGYLTPDEEFAQLVESSVPEAALLDDVLGQGYAEDGTVEIGAGSWRRLRTTNGELALLLTDSGTTFLVTGSASEEQLRLLAAALHPIS